MPALGQSKGSICFQPIILCINFSHILPKVLISPMVSLGPSYRQTVGIQISIDHIIFFLIFPSKKWSIFFMLLVYKFLGPVLSQAECQIY